MAEFVRLEVQDGIGTIRLDRPPMNPISLQVQAEVEQAALEAGRRSDVAAVIVYGGERVFAAGADVKEMQTMSYTDMVDAVDGLHSYVRVVSDIPKPTVAAITGFALGGGCELALACDFRIAGDTAKLGLPEILLGIIPGMGATQRLPRLVGTARAKELVFSGRFVGADEALALGLVDKVVPHDQVYTAAREWMGRFVGGPAYALRAAKQAIDEGIDTDLETGLALERGLFAGLFATEDRQLGMDSFVAEGPGKARFVGR